MVFRDIIWPVAMTANVPHNGTNEKGMLNRQEGVTRLPALLPRFDWPRPAGGGGWME